MESTSWNCTHIADVRCVADTRPCWDRREARLSLCVLCDLLLKDSVFEHEETEERVQTGGHGDHGGR